MQQITTKNLPSPNSPEFPTWKEIVFSRSQYAGKHTAGSKFPLNSVVSESEKKSPFKSFPMPEITTNDPTFPLPPHFQKRKEIAFLTSKMHKIASE